MSSKPRPPCAASSAAANSASVICLGLRTVSSIPLARASGPNVLTRSGFRTRLVSATTIFAGPAGISSIRWRCMRPIGPPPPTIQATPPGCSSGAVARRAVGRADVGAGLAQVDDVVVVDAADIHRDRPGQRPLADHRDDARGCDDTARRFQPLDIGVEHDDVVEARARLRLGQRGIIGRGDAVADRVGDARGVQLAVQRLGHVGGDDAGRRAARERHAQAIARGQARFAQEPERAARLDAHPAPRGVGRLDAGPRLGQRDLGVAQAVRHRDA